MKILMLTPYLPFPPSSGGQVRSYNLLKHLSLKHEITLYSLIKDDTEKIVAKVEPPQKIEEEAPPAEEAVVEGEAGVAPEGEAVPEAGGEAPKEAPQEKETSSEA